ncbi:hypothetical protein [Rhizobium leguminosarum]|uniref:hypothetical protein n=1 Tax=Rhizobium leguminosarum TaxID=384 RepID=UPI001441976B|nr:hypothetical protein [Rhizobium leguminosarum]MBY5869327.1 hypothetical protein [Rhizobium leguminosarum]NKM08393.1 hypothetical protein [Rhizobium leguminosarum bv. viciae]
MAAELVESKTAFAKRLNLSKAYISNLTKSGLPCNAHGFVRVDAAIKWIRENVNAGPGRPLGSVEVGETDDLTTAKTRLLLAQAAKAEMELAKMRGELIPADLVKRFNFTFFRMARDHALNFPYRRGPEIAAEFNLAPGAFAAVLERALIEHLREASDAIIPFRTETAAQAAGHCPHCHINLNHPRAESTK